MKYNTKSLITLITFLSVASIANASIRKIENNTYSANVVRVIDGDTIEIDVNTWLGATQRINLRLYGANTPEKRGKGVSDCEKLAAIKATKFTEKWLDGIGEVMITNVKNGSFAGRAVGALYHVDKGFLHRALIGSGNAVIYYGGKRSPWC